MLKRFIKVIGFICFLILLPLELCYRVIKYIVSGREPFNDDLWLEQIENW